QESRLYLPYLPQIPVSRRYRGYACRFVTFLYARTLFAGFVGQLATGRINVAATAPSDQHRDTRVFELAHIVFFSCFVTAVVLAVTDRVVLYEVNFTRDLLTVA